VLNSALHGRGFPLYRDQCHEHVPLGAKLSHHRVRSFSFLPAHECAVFNINRAQLAAEPIEFAHVIPPANGP